MISCPTVTKREIQYHYDWSTAFYRLLWGPHIHHGLWHGEESPAVAQRQLIEAMASRLTLKPNQRMARGSTVPRAHGVKRSAGRGVRRTGTAATIAQP